MLLALVLLLASPELPAMAESAPGMQCLPAGDGFLAMRLRGSIEEDLRWSEPALECAGMARPDGRGLRLRFAGRHAGGELAVVFAAPGLAMGAAGRGVPVNVTLLDGAGERIYGTQGDSRCSFDEVEQQPLEDAALPPRSFRVAARGFCVAPARAIDGDGAVLLTRFDFVGLVTWGEDEAVAEPASLRDPFPGLARTDIEAVTASGTHRFSVWLAADDRSRQQGLMHVRELPPDRGMLFLFEEPQEVAFWMKNTYLSLDLVFIDPAGRVLNIADNARPLSLDPIPSAGPVIAVLEVVAGTARRIGLAPGDAISLPTLRTTWTTMPAAGEGGPVSRRPDGLGSDGKATSITLSGAF